MTLVNPSYMTRQVHELERLDTGVKSHITSLSPIRAQNGPDDWETLALEQFERGQTESTTTGIIDGKPHLRYMKSLIAEKACLKCHAAQGYHEGDIRGGISVSVPLEPLEAPRKSFVLNSFLLCLVILITGLAGIFSSYRAIGRYITKENQTRIENEKLSGQLFQAQELKTIGQLAAGIAHEINTPVQYLTSNNSFLEHSFDEIRAAFTTLKNFGLSSPPLLSKEAIDELLEKLDWEYLQNEIPTVIQQSATGLEQVSKIVLAMKEFSHPGSSEKVATNINHIIENVMTICQNEWKYADEMTTRLDPQLPDVPLLVNET
jgi:signal transduction histidine kinase